MLYTIGKTEAYEKYIKGDSNPEKGKGGTVWEYIEDVLDYLREISNGSEYTVYGVIADWLKDTKLPEWNGEESKNKPENIKYRELLRDAPLVKLMEPVGLLTRGLPSFNCKGDVMNNKDRELEITKEISRKYHFLKVNGKWDCKDYPMQNWNDDTIPLVVAEEGYKEYILRGGSGQTLKRLGERGGFAGSELSILLFERIKRLEMEMKMADDVLIRVKEEMKKILEVKELERQKEELEKENKNLYAFIKEVDEGKR